MLSTTFYSNGKLLLTGEYIVLDGALALAVPTRFGQSLTIKEKNTEQILHWKSITNTGEVWLDCIFSWNSNNELTYSKTDNIGQTLCSILNQAKQLNKDFLKSPKGYSVESKLDFPKNWGLGSSSTLLNNIAQWAKIDAFKLSDATFGGSGYDIACASNNTPILYTTKASERTIQPIDFHPEFSKNIWFVHLNIKQDSREGIKHYKSKSFDIDSSRKQITQISNTLINNCDFTTFCKNIDLHEEIISNITNQDTVKNRLFKDFNGSIKSLGAWGGDFILAASNQDPSDYFKSKGFNTILPYSKMVL